MKPKAFDYLKAGSTDEALQALAEGGDDTRIIAGGMSLVPMLNFRLVEPSILVDISKIADMNYIREDGGMVEIGNSTRQVQLEKWDGLADKLPMLHAALQSLPLYRPLSDPRARHGVRLARPCRSVLRIAAVAGNTGRRGGVAVQIGQTEAFRRRLPDRHAVDRQAGR